MFNIRLLFSFLFSFLLHVVLIFQIYFDSANVNTKLWQHATAPPILTKVRITKGLPTVRRGNLDLTTSGSIATKNTLPPIAKHQNNPETRNLHPLVEDRSWGVRLPLSSTKYHTSAELTKKPQALTNPELDPPDVKSILATGTLILKLWINAFGDVDKVAIEQTDLPELMATTAADVFRKIRFHPGEINEQRVASVIRIEIQYDDDRLVAP